MEFKKIKIFADGADINSILELNKNPLIKGFTTNPTLMKKAGVTDYKEFAQELLDKIDNKPISFEVFADDINEMEKQAFKISYWGSNVNIKIPITNTKKESTVNLISKLTNSGITCNVTAVFTVEQLESIIDKIENDSKIIISVFAGRIADTGVDPCPIMKKCSLKLKNMNNAELLWASPRELLNIFQAESCGCDIITVPNDLLSKMSNIDKNLEQFSLETVSMFYDDAVKAGYFI